MLNPPFVATGHPNGSADQFLPVPPFGQFLPDFVENGHRDAPADKPDGEDDREVEGSVDDFHRMPPDWVLGII